MGFKHFSLIAVTAVTVAGCAQKVNHDNDLFSDIGELEQKIKWGIYVDPDGCDTWIADDGIEGYAVARLEPRTGARVCSGVLPDGHAGGHKQRTGIDPV
jgi:hypothetical protein